MKTMHWLAQPTNPGGDPAAWESFLRSLKVNIDADWAAARGAYLALKQVRESFGWPFIVDHGSAEAAAPGASPGSAWNSSLEAQARDLMSMVALISSALGEAADGKRKLVFDEADQQLEIGTLPGDLLRLELQQGVPVLVNAQTGAIEHPTGTIGIPTIVWVATATVSVLALPAYYVTNAAVNNMRAIAEQKTLQTVAERGYDCIKSGKCTPEDVQKINGAITTAAVELKREDTKKAEAEKTQVKDWTGLVKTAGIFALGLGAIYLLARVIPPAPRRAAAATPLSENTCA